MSQTLTEILHFYFFFVLANNIYSHQPNQYVHNRSHVDVNNWTWNGGGCTPVTNNLITITRYLIALWIHFCTTKPYPFLILHHIRQSLWLSQLNCDVSK